MKAKIFEIKRFAVHDGDGIRTTLFLKGCPLRCVWCHNPEGLTSKTQLAYHAHKCISCGECAEVCSSGAHKMSSEGHVYLKESCIECGKCTEVCLGNALTLYGKEYSAEELLPILLEDREFYENSEGGVTISGGECLLQADFCRELLGLLKAEGINTAVDTCGFVPRENLDLVMPYTDTFLYDLKAFDENVHIKCTAQSNKLILENLKYLDRCGKNIEIRIPYVPNYNDGEMEKIAKFISELKNVRRIRVLPYHSYAGSKYEALGMKNCLPATLPSKEELETARETICTITGLDVQN